MERLPNALEPNSHLPLYQPTILPSFIFLAIQIVNCSSLGNLNCLGLLPIASIISLFEACDEIFAHN
jgi:hypothetical protein